MGSNVQLWQSTAASALAYEIMRHVVMDPKLQDRAGRMKTDWHCSK